MRNHRCCFSILTLFYLVIILSCNARTEKEKEIKKNAELNTISLKAVTSDSLFDAFYNRLTEMLNFKDLKNQHNGTEIRIWLQYYLSDSMKVVRIYGDSSDWASQAYYLKINVNQTENHEISSVAKSTQIGNPIGGWNKFLKTIEDYGIFNLKDYSNISNYDLGNDGDDIIVEIAKNNEYKRYRLFCYGANKEKISEVKNILKVLYLIQNEFGFRLFPRPKIDN